MSSSSLSSSGGEGPSISDVGPAASRVYTSSGLAIVQLTVVS